MSRDQDEESNPNSQLNRNLQDAEAKRMMRASPFEKPKILLVAFETTDAIEENEVPLMRKQQFEFYQEHNPDKDVSFKVARDSLFCCY